MIPSENNETIVDTSTLAHDDLLDAYEKLAQKYVDLKEENDCLNQKIHQETSQKKVLENTLNDCQAEINSINDVHLKNIQSIEKKNEELRIKNQTLIMEKIAQENTIDELCAKVKELKDVVKEMEGLLAVKTIKPRVSDAFAKSLEIENENLRATIHEMQEQIDELTTKCTGRDAKIEELTESYECATGNLERKKIELDEKSELLDHLNEKVHELSTELALLKNSESLVDDANRKGNSLFAEVDDQRQKMKNILKGERSHYLEMKKAYNYKEMEIRRLKRENLNIKSEIQACSNQLKRGEQLSSNHQRIYISNLETDKVNLEKELKLMEHRLTDLAKEQKMHWVETLLTTSSKESRDLKDKNYVLLREKTTLADNHSKALKELARVRLDSIKLKVLLGRLVDDFKLKIDESRYCDLDIDDRVFENLKLEDYQTSQEVILVENPDNIENESNNSGMLNESTIHLLGGREKLGSAIPKVQQATQIFPEKIDNAPVTSHAQINRENLAFAFEKLPAFCSTMEDDSVKCKFEIQESPVKAEKSGDKENDSNRVAEKDIKSELSNKIESAIKENEAAPKKKKQLFTVTRITIPSKKPRTT